MQRDQLRHHGHCGTHILPMFMDEMCATLSENAQVAPDTRKEDMLLTNRSTRVSSVLESRFRLHSSIR